MKKHLLFITLAILPFLVFSQTLVPEASWIDGNERDWCDKGIGTTFMSFNGILYAFNYQGNGYRNGGHAYMYTVNAGNKTTQSDLNDVNLEDYKVGPKNSHNNKLEFNFPYEGSSADEGPVLGRTFAFQFEGRAWYFQHILSYFGDESYECYAQLPIYDSIKCLTYYKTISPPSKHWKQGGFQLDSLVYFLVYKDDDKYWEIDEHYYSSGNNIKFQSNGNDFKFDPYIESVGANLRSFHYFGGMVRRLDSLDNEYFVATFYNQTGIYVIGKIVPGITNGKRSFTWEEVLAEPDPPVIPPELIGTRAFPFYVGATALCQGTFKGNRTANQIPNKEQNDRLVLFGESNTKSSDGYFHVAYCEFHFENDLLVKDASGEIMVPTSRGPSTVSDNFHLYASYQLVPKDYSTMLSGTDGYQSYMWLLYPDHDRNFNGAMFLSDSWRHDPALFEESADLNQDTVYEGIKDVWTLLGIFDGSPPISMDWEKWAEHWGGFPTPATWIEFESDSSGSSDFLTSYENEWSIGEKMEYSFGNEARKYSLSESFKFSQTFRSTNDQSITKSFTIGIPFDLFEENQDYGFYIYSVPEIRRYSFMTYPWWDENTLQYPVESSFQYLFVTFGNYPVPYPVKLDQFPFYVDEPNDPTMEGWFNYAGRSFICDQADNYELFPVLHLDWVDLSGGSHQIIQTSVEDKTSNSQTLSWDFEVEAGVTNTHEVPDVCKVKKSLSLGAGYSGSLISKTSSTSEIGHRIYASLENLHFASTGPNVNGLHLWAYLFTPENNPNWWYFDSLNGQKPFYLAWVVHSSKQSLELQTPANGSRVEQGNLLFSWMPDYGELHGYKLFISKSSNISNYNAVFQKQLGRATAISVSDFQPEPGETYYWAVKAYDQEEQVVYSPIWSFTLAKEEEQEEPSETELKAVVYPNPGRSSDISIAIGPISGGKVLLQLIDINGALVTTKQLNTNEGATSIITLSTTDLPAGFYLAVIRTENEEIVKKVIVK